MFMDDDFEESWISRNRGIVMPAVILLILAGVVLYFLHDTAGMRREAPPLPTLIATLPPPPPPPPKPPEPEKKIEEVQKPIDEPKQPDDAPKPMTINGPAQAVGEDHARATPILVREDAICLTRQVHGRAAHAGAVERQLAHAGCLAADSAAPRPTAASPVGAPVRARACPAGIERVLSSCWNAYHSSCIVWRGFSMKWPV